MEERKGGSWRYRSPKPQGKGIVPDEKVLAETCNLLKKSHFATPQRPDSPIVATDGVQWYWRTPRGGFNSPTTFSDIYLDKPYILCSNGWR